MRKYDLTTIGTLIIYGSFPQSLDGLFLGYSESKSIRFSWTVEGFERKGKLYKTQDPAKLIELLGVIDARYTVSISKKIK